MMSASTHSAMGMVIVSFFSTSLRLSSFIALMSAVSPVMCTLTFPSPILRVISSHLSLRSSMKLFFVVWSLVLSYVRMAKELSLSRAVSPVMCT